MAEELGKIEKLDIEQFGLRKLYVVPLIDLLQCEWALDFRFVRPFHIVVHG